MNNASNFLSVKSDTNVKLKSKKLLFLNPDGQQERGELIINYAYHINKERIIDVKVLKEYITKLKTLVITPEQIAETIFNFLINAFKVFNLEVIVKLNERDGIRRDMIKKDF